MEKFEMDEGKMLEVFDNFVTRTNGNMSSVVENINGNIEKYEEAIERTQGEIEEYEESSLKCQNEIKNMEARIASVEGVIENVENTYKKMVDAYSSTSKGETKELYSEIIEGAKSNCEEDVKKNKLEITRLTDDISAIKNNINGFTKIIDDLNIQLDNSKLELMKYKKVLEFITKINEKMAFEFDKISNLKTDVRSSSRIKRTIDEPIGIKTKEKTNDITNTSKKEDIVIPDYKETESPKGELIDEVDNIDFNLEEPAISLDKHKTSVETENTESNHASMSTVEPINFDDSLKQIYDLTGYKPKKDEKETEKSKSAVDNNLNSQVGTSEENKESKSQNLFQNTDMSEWEKILNNNSDDSVNNSSQTTSSNITSTSSMQNIENDASETVDQLLKPYGTSYSRLKNLTTDHITYKDGHTTPFIMSSDDVIKAVNAVDGLDLKAMKTVGPEITLLRKIKAMREGNL